MYPLASNSISRPDTPRAELENSMRGMTLDQMCELHDDLIRQQEQAQERLIICREYLEGCQKRIIHELSPRPQAARS